MKVFKRFILFFISFFMLCNFIFATNFNNLPVKIVLDPANTMLSLPIALPNDLNTNILDETGSVVKLPIEAADTASVQLLKSAINSLNIKGLSPDTGLAIPLNSSESIDLESLYSSLYLIPFMKDLSTAPSYNTSPNIIAGPEKLYIIQEKNIIKIYFKTKVEYDTKYVVVINKGVKTAKGELIGRDPAFEFLMRGKDYYLPLIQGLGLDIDNILAMFTFSTGDKTLKLSAFSKLMTGNPYTSDDTLSYSEPSSELASIVAAVQMLPSSVSSYTSDTYSTLPYFKTKFTSYNITTLSTSPAPIDVPTIILPNGVTNKVVIYQHGLGQDKSSAFALASKFLAAGYPIISADMTMHGDRVDSTDLTNFDCNGDGVTSSGECFFTTNLVQDRVNLYQAVFDLTVMIKNLKAGKFDINGDGIGDVVNDIYYVGISLGSIVGSMVAEYNIDNLKKIALSVGGADLGALLDGTKIPSLTSAISSLGLEKNSGEYFVFLGMLHLVLDPADPLYNVDSKIKDKTIVQTANGDIIVPNSSNAVLAGAIGFTMPQVITDTENNDLITNPVAGWYQFGAGSLIVPHTFLLTAEGANEKYQEIDPDVYYDEDFIEKAHNAAQEQIINFFNK